MARVTKEEVEMFKPGVYVHYKGPQYHALFLVEDSTNRDGADSTQEPMVVYVPLEGDHCGTMKARELWQWNERVPVRPEFPKPSWIKRFMPLDEWKKTNK